MYTEDNDDDKVDHHDWKGINFWGDSTFLSNANDGDDITFDKSTVSAIHAKYAEYLKTKSTSKLDDFWVI